MKRIWQAVRDMGSIIHAILMVVFLLFTGVMLSGCSVKSPAEFIAETRSISGGSNEQAVTNACLQWVENKDKLELASYEKIPNNERSFALMHRETMNMVKDVWGKGNECKPGTNQWDAYIAYVKETEESHRQYSSDAKSVATFGIVTTGAVKLVDSLAGVAGDRINTTGDNSGVTKTTTNTTTATTNTAVAADKSTATNGATGASGTAGTAATGTASAVTSAQWNECVTTTGGARPSTAEINGCMIGYGHNTTYEGDQIFLDGQPYNGPTAVK